jgi:RNA polymerase sigma-70 factor (ECF subfamily)
VEKEFIELIKIHKNILHKICTVYFFRNPYREDYYQEMLIRVWKAFPGFKNQSAFSTWLYRVALNTAIDIVRKQYLEPIHTELSKKEYNIPDLDSNTSFDKRDILYQAIDHLSDVEKAITILYLDDYSYKEIAEITGISESNTGVKINRIKNRLIKIVNDGQK